MQEITGPKGERVTEETMTGAAAGPIPIDVRQQRRFKVDQPVKIAVLQSPELRLSGRLRNVSNSGMRLEVDCVLPARSPVKIEWDGRFLLGSIRYSNQEDGACVAGVELFASWESLTADLLAAERAELARSNADLQQFAYVASHDLKEPLRMVTSYLQLLERRCRGKLDADGEQFIRFALEGAARMELLLSDLLAYSRVSGGETALAPVDMGEALDQALSNLRPAIADAGAVVSSAPLPIVIANQSRMVQLLQNLVGNAVKFRGPEPPRVQVRAERNGAEWVFAVRDNGIGIEQEHRQRVFQMFERLHARGQYPGNGIGLAIARRIVERLGGRIWVESQVGKGSIFYFTVPERG